MLGFARVKAVFKQNFISQDLKLRVGLVVSLIDGLIIIYYYFSN